MSLTCNQTNRDEYLPHAQAWWPSNQQVFTGDIVNQATWRNDTQWIVFTASCSDMASHGGDQDHLPCLNNPTFVWFRLGIIRIFIGDIVNQASQRDDTQWIVFTASCSDIPSHGRDQEHLHCLKNPTLVWFRLGIMRIFIGDNGNQASQRDDTQWIVVTASCSDIPSHGRDQEHLHCLKNPMFVW